MRTAKDTWLIPVEHEESWQPAMLRSTDQFVTWELIDIPALGLSLIQPAVVQLADGNLLAYMRSWEGCIYENKYVDEGQTWSSASRTEIPNNNSGLDMTRLQSGNRALAFNRAGLRNGLRSDGKKQWGPRSPLNLALSTNEGASWDHELVLEQEQGKYSYPSLFQTWDGHIHVLYTENRHAIKHVVVTEDELAMASGYLLRKIGD